MKKVLIVTNLYHASPRIPGFVKNMKKYKWEPVLLTSKLGNKPSSSFGPPDTFTSKYKTYQVDYKKVLHKLRKVLGISSSDNPRERIVRSNNNIILNKILTFVGSVFNYPDSEKHWIDEALKISGEIIKYEKPDLIFSSSSPVSAHIIASELKRKYKIPWIAELRDLWSCNHNYPYGPIRRWKDRNLERKTLCSADMLITVSSPWAEVLEKSCPDIPVEVITNGFDEGVMPASSKDISNTGVFTVAYTGNIYPAKQNLGIFYKALSELIEQGSIQREKIKVHFYGPDKDIIEHNNEIFNLKGTVVANGTVPRDLSFKKQREADLLLLFNWEDRSEKGCYPLKIFEYLSASRPILATGGYPGDVVNQLLDSTRSGTAAFTIDDIKSRIIEHYNHYFSESKVKYEADEHEVLKYTYKELTKKLIEQYYKLC